MSDNSYMEVLSSSLNCTTQINKEFSKFKERKEKIYKTLETNKIIRFLSIKELINISKQDYYSYELNETLSYPKLIITKKQFKQYMIQIADFLLNESNFQICLFHEDFKGLESSFFYWCQKNEYLLIYDNNSLNLKYCRDISFTASLAKLFEKNI